MSDAAEHYKALFERHRRESEFYQAQLYHAWKSLRQQTKGMNRMSRKIKRLQDQLRPAVGKTGDL